MAQTDKIRDTFEKATVSLFPEVELRLVRSLGLTLHRASMCRRSSATREQPRHQRGVACLHDFVLSRDGMLDQDSSQLDRLVVTRQFYNATIEQLLSVYLVGVLSCSSQSVNQSVVSSDGGQNISILK